MKEVPIKNGSLFLVPLASGKFAIGVLLHADGRGRSIGAFFGPAVDSSSDVEPIKLAIEDAKLVCRFGDHGLHTKRWQVIGAIPSWSESPWTALRFARLHDNPELKYVTEYDESLNVLSEQLVPAVEAKGLPQDAQFGSGVVEAKLSKLIL